MYRVAPQRTSCILFTVDDISFLTIVDVDSNISIYWRRNRSVFEHFGQGSRFAVPSFENFFLLWNDLMNPVSSVVIYRWRIFHFSRSNRLIERFVLIASIDKTWHLLNHVIVKYSSHLKSIRSWYWMVSTCLSVFFSILHHQCLYEHVFSQPSNVLLVSS